MSTISSYPGGLDQFFAQHRVAKGCSFTHTSLHDPVMSMYIPSDDLDVFYDLYADALDAKKNLHLTEKHRHVSPVLIDVDLRFSDTTSVIRRYTMDDTQAIIKIYGEVLGSYVKRSHLDFYLFEKQTPRLEKGVVKDGFHIMVPGVVTKHAVQHVVRKHVLIPMKPIMKKIGATNDTSDIFDEAVISKNNWFLCGSKKHNGEPYQLTRIYRYDVSLNSISTIPRPEDLASSHAMVTFFSIRNKEVSCEIIQDKNAEIDALSKKMSEKLRRKEMASKIIGSAVNANENECGNLDDVISLVRILSPSRCDEYISWMRLGWCLRNLDHRLLPAWDEISKNSKKYKPGECDKMWRFMKPTDGLGIGTLRSWARTDNPIAYSEIASNDIQQLIYESSTRTHHDISKVIQYMFQYDFVCSSLRNRSWFEFKNHRWHISDCGLGLRLKISTDVWKEYNKAVIKYCNLANASLNPVDQNRYQEMVKKFSNIAGDLRNQTFKEKLVKECEELFYVDKFEEKLDSNTDLIGFEDGVFELNTMTFRPGKHDDYISFSTGINYVAFDPNHPIVHQINDYLAQVLVKPTVRDYVMRLFASFLSGRIPDQKVYIWTGCGSNSKSKLVELFESCMRDYCCKFPVTLITGKRAASNAASSELVRSKGKRLSVLQEPSEGESFNLGILKEISGGDRIMARALFKEPIEFKPQFKILLLCNELPNVNSDDNGTWRRLRAIEFTSKFCENPREPNEFPLDMDLSSKMEHWSEHFMSMILTVYYPKYRDEGIIEPQEVKDSTNEYRCQSDHLAQYLSARITANIESFITVDDMLNDYREWCKSEGCQKKIQSRTNFTKYMTKNMKNKAMTPSSDIGFRGYAFRVSSPGSFIDMDDDA